MTDPVLEKLDELIRVTRESSLPDRYLDAEGVAAVLGFSYTYTRDRIVHLPGFPKPLKMGDGHSRWLYSAVIKWGKARSA